MDTVIAMELYVGTCTDTDKDTTGTFGGASNGKKTVTNHDIHMHGNRHRYGHGFGN